MMIDLDVTMGLFTLDQLTASAAGRNPRWLWGAVQENAGLCGRGFSATGVG